MSIASAQASRGCARQSFSSAEPAADGKRLARRLRALRAFLEPHLIGAAELVERLLVALLADGHALIEGAPGLAKTRAAKLLAEGLDALLARIQCTLT